jgi:hypothetical protein
MKKNFPQNGIYDATHATEDVEEFAANGSEHPDGNGKFEGVF